ncbi:MAG: hypothetical protein B1H02_05810 [Candidatus Latescibacteria bacterium 4484_107]|nr:MAG: hypothetical protein B1H02_05810 [Candidatus Latescibacteria bacterium 4484_107]
MAVISAEELLKGDVNLYEVSIAAGKEARKRNEFQRLKRDAGEMDDQHPPVKVTVEVLQELMDGRARCVNPAHRWKH